MPPFYMSHLVDSVRSRELVRHECTLRSRRRDSGRVVGAGKDVEVLKAGRLKSESPAARDPPELLIGCMLRIARLGRVNSRLSISLA